MVARGKRETIAAVCAGLTLGSFVLSLNLMNADPKGAFYIAHARAWELGAGALVAIAPRRWFQCHPLVGETMPVLGLALIVFSGIQLSVASPFPGVNALSAVVGAALVVAPWIGPSTIAVGLSTTPFVLIGKMSYSLYLWHWPILVFFKHYSFRAHPGLLEVAALLCGIFSLSWLSWSFVELPARRSRLPKWTHIGAGISAATAVACVSFIVVTEDGFAQRIPETARGMRSLTPMWQWDCPQFVTHPDLGNKAHCAVGESWETATTRGVIWGDSHAQHFACSTSLRKIVALFSYYSQGTVSRLSRTTVCGDISPNSLPTFKGAPSGAVGCCRFLEPTKMLRYSWSRHPGRIIPLNSTSMTTSPALRSLGLN